MRLSKPLSCGYCGGDVWKHNKNPKDHLCGSCGNMLNKKANGPKYRMWVRAGRPLIGHQKWEEVRVKFIGKMRRMDPDKAKGYVKATGPSEPAPAPTSAEPVERPQRLPQPSTDAPLPDPLGLPMDYLVRCVEELKKRLWSMTVGAPPGTQLSLFFRS